MEQHVTAVQVFSKGGHVSHIAFDQFDAVGCPELLTAFFHRTHQGFDPGPLRNQLTHQVIAEQSGRAGDKRRLYFHHD